MAARKSAIETGGESRVAKTAKKPAAPAFMDSLFFFLRDSVTADLVDERTESMRIRRLLRLIRLQAWIMVALVFILLGNILFPRSFYFYNALSSDHKVMELVPLIMPNVTNQALLSWATNSITEIMTFGFGDYQTHLRDQRMRFTPEGWKNFSGAFDKMKIGEAFRQRQLVLTTVPSNVAVIVWQGVNKDQVYEWHVQMPVIMTYATNDNVTKHDSAVIALTIVRVSTADNPAGIGIESWKPGEY